MTEFDKTVLDHSETEEQMEGQEREEELPVRIENKVNEIRDEIGSRINPLFVAANRFSSNVRQALDLETDPGLLEEPEYGDVICVHRIGYEHYGIYVGNGRVIHYDIDPTDHYKICIHQAPMEEFLNGSLVYSICEFPKVYGRPTEEIPFAEFRKKFAHPEKAQTLWDVLKISNYHLYTPEETVIRARERIGETQYSLWTNNCEHFAIWCKTGKIREGLRAGLAAAADLAEEVGKRIEEREKEQTKQGTNSV